MYDSNDNLRVGRVAALVVVSIVGLVIFFEAWGFVSAAIGRYQKVADAHNEIQVNDMKIGQTKQLVEVEKQKAQIRVIEAGGIAQSQEIINKTLTDKYLQHEAIDAQKSMANSPNHTTIYVPSGQNGIPLVQTTNGQ